MASQTSLIGHRRIYAHSTKGNTINVLSQEPRHTFLHFDDDGPGPLSQEGPRHDNDHVDYRDIKILPTTDEILAVSRPQFMPKKNATENHFLPHGPIRLLDIHFRHLRYDSVEMIRDICYNAAQLLFVEKKETSEYCDESFLQTSAGNRYHLYGNARVEDTIPNERKGIIIRISFECPTSLKNQAMHKSDRLESNMLCALLVFNKARGELSIIYMDAYLRESSYSMTTKGSSTSRAAVQLSFHSNATHDDILQVMSVVHRIGNGETEIALVEFPNILTVGITNPLHRLQQMRGNDFAFHEYLAPLPGSFEDILKIPPPQYCLGEGFQYDLSPLTAGSQEHKLPVDAFGAIERTQALEYVMENTTLDEGQAVAFYNSLSRQFAFTQGPPGTGKTFLGVALTRVLLASRISNNQKPILVVCLTNHALDSFLAGLRDAEISKLCRIGNGSKEEWTKSISLYQRGRGFQQKGDEYYDLKGVLSQKEQHYGMIEAWCSALSQNLETGRPSWVQIESILEKRYPDIHLQLLTLTSWVVAQGMVFEYWAGGGELEDMPDIYPEFIRLLAESFALPFETPDQAPEKRKKQQNATVDSPSVGARQNNQSLQQYTRQPNSKCLAQCEKPSQSGEHRSSTSSATMTRVFHEILGYVVERHGCAKEDSVWLLQFGERQQLISEWTQHIDKNESARDFAYIQSQYQEILAAERELRNQKDIRVLLQQDVIGVTTTGCASRWDVLCSVAPEILICEEAGEVMEPHALCALLPSLKHAVFIGDPLQLRPEVNERIMTLETRAGVPYRLDESLFERFMYPHDPQAPIMPTSQLHIQRRMHPEIAQVSRLTYPFLLDHTDTMMHPVPIGLTKRVFWLDHRNPEVVDAGMSNSTYNPYEVAVVKAFVQYLLRGSEFSLGDIAVLTPYSAQLKKLKESLETTCPIILSEEDKDILVDIGELDPEEADEAQVKTDVRMNGMLRLATIDNFQGEEAKVIILSSVRSGGKPGFLKTRNRINVACSRARDGFYVVGNAETLAQVPMWKQIIRVLGEKGCVGPALRLQCNRHPDHTTAASTAKDFDGFPECSESCAVTLPCGHVCPHICHPLSVHDQNPCAQLCSTIFECGHNCEKPCGAHCDTCTREVGVIELPCGHVGSRLCSGAVPACTWVEEIRVLPCSRHVTDVLCEQQDRDYICTNKCATPLECGHTCTLLCEVCKKFGMHELCTRKCDEILLCGHKCGVSCHADKVCPPCKAACENSCMHGRCKNGCGTECDPCVKMIPSTETGTPSIICAFSNEDCNVTRILDKLLQKSYTKMYGLARGIETATEQLNSTLASFTNDIRPNPLATKENMQLVVGRYRKLRDIQDQIIDYRRDTVDAIEHSMHDLHTARPEDVPAYNMILHLQFDTLEFRAVTSRLQDELRIASSLCSVEGVSPALGCRVIEMMQSTVTECLAYIGHCQVAIQDPKLSSSPIIDTEIRVCQLQLRLIAHNGQRGLSDATEGAEALYDLPVSDQVLLDNLAIVERTTKHHTTTLDPYLAMIPEFRRNLITVAAIGIKVPKVVVPQMSNKARHQIEKSWARHRVGNLKRCRAMHPYAKSMALEGCPFCGLWHETDEERSKRAQAHLFEDAFLAALEARSSRKPP